jgi:hypothetical protein
MLSLADYESSEESAYSMRSPANTKRLLEKKLRHLKAVIDSSVRSIWTHEPHVLAGQGTQVDFKKQRDAPDRFRAPACLQSHRRLHPHRLAKISRRRLIPHDFPTWNHFRLASPPHAAYFRLLLWPPRPSSTSARDTPSVTTTKSASFSAMS